MRNIGSSLVVAVIALSAVAPASALATSFGVMAWGDNASAQLGVNYPTNYDVPLTLRQPTEVSAVSAGGEFSLALLENGAVEAWGSDVDGELGVGSYTGPETCHGWACSRTSVPVHLLTLATAVSAGEDFGLALQKTGNVEAWGSNELGQLGDGTYTGPETCTIGACSTMPEEVRGLSNVTAISAGPYFSLALENGHVLAWGENTSGELGDGTDTGPETCDATLPCSTTPVLVRGLSEVLAIAAGSEHGLALLKDGKVLAWGQNEFGELGDGTTTSTDEPVEVLGLGNNVLAISAGGEFSLALLKDGKVLAWGQNYVGELGDGSAEGPEKCGGDPCSVKPVEVKGLSSVAGISAGYEHSLARLEDGKVVAWGASSYGDLGDGAITGPEKCKSRACSRVPVETDKLSRYVAGVSAGSTDSLAYGPPGPIANKIAPSTGSPSGGEEVTITGLNFVEVTAVKFGATEASKFLVDSPTTILALSPPGSGKVKVKVTTASGTIATSTSHPETEFRYVTQKAPEYGRCLKVTTGTGKYSSGDCATEEAGGSYEWTPGVGKAYFTLSGGAGTLETVGETRIVCKTESGTGEYSGTKEIANEVLELAGCEYEGSKCTTAGAATGEIVTSALRGELGWKNKKTGAVALDLLPEEEEAPIAEAKCGSAPVVVQGSVIVPLTKDTMQTADTLQYEEAKGKQQPERFEGEPKDVLEASIAGEAFEQAGLTVTSTQTNEEEVEVNTGI